MDNILKKLSKLKKNFLIKEKENKTAKQEINKILSDIFVDYKNYAKYVVSTHFKADKLIIETKNKVFASEIFIKKEQILSKLKEIKIRQIIIR